MMTRRTATQTPPGAHVVLTRKNPHSPWTQAASFTTAEQAHHAATLLARENANTAACLAMTGYANPTTRRGRKALANAKTTQTREYSVASPASPASPASAQPTQSTLALAA